uniref:Uncharacterized protein n=1 Tax=Morchella importuna TaxID=1174673 RepID=A0A650AF84_9PEZI|nr:hypothetical protein [Morchella importuna]QGN66647.1 hypothetical protein [Morchella importuna]
MTQNTIHSEGGGVVYNSSSLASRALRARTLPSLQFFYPLGRKPKKKQRGEGTEGGSFGAQRAPLQPPGGAASKLLAVWSTTNTFWIYLIVISLIIFSLASLFGTFVVQQTIFPLFFWVFLKKRGRPGLAIPIYSSPPSEPGGKTSVPRILTIKSCSAGKIKIRRYREHDCILRGIRPIGTFIHDDVGDLHATGRIEHDRRFGRDKRLERRPCKSCSSPPLHPPAPSERAYGGGWRGVGEELLL